MINNFSLNNLQFKTNGSGKAIFFVHGFPLSSAIWNSQIDFFSNKGFQSIALDLPGFGESKLQKQIFSLDAYADSIIHLLDYLKIEQSIFVGMSMGGYTLFNLAERYPERVSALVLIATKSEADDENGKLKRTNLINFCKEKGKGEVIDAFMKILWADETWQNKKYMIDNIKSEMDKASEIGIISGLIAMRDRKDYSKILDKIKIPTLIIHSTKDKAIPIDFAKSMNYKIKNSLLKIYETGAHMINMEEALSINNDIFEFIKEI